MRFLADLANSNTQLSSTWAIVRTSVAGAPLLTLVANTPETIFPSLKSLTDQGRCEGLAGALVACLLDDSQYGWGAHLTLIALFSIAASGLLPMISGPLHFYAALSFMNVLGTVDGGEQAALVFSVWALPICLVDTRLSHWQRWQPAESHEASWKILQQSTVTVFLFVMKLQVSFIYLQACLSKLAVSEWTDGTSFYYWTVDGYLPAPTPFAELVAWMATTPLITLAATYGTLLLEFTLGISLLIKSQRIRRALWGVAILFHLMIGVTFGIWSFSVVMMALATVLLAPDRLQDWREKAEERTPHEALEARPL